MPVWENVGIDDFGVFDFVDFGRVVDFVDFGRAVDSGRAVDF